MSPREIEVLGVPIMPLKVPELHSLISGAVAADQKLVVTSQNLHGVYLYHRTEKMRALHARSIPRVDGMPLVMVARLLGHAVGREHRVTWVDWMDPLMDEAVRNEWRVFYLGSKSDIVEKGADVLRHQHPGLSLAVHHGHFNMTIGGDENQQVIEKINQYRPNVLMVGMGMPRQEIWVHNNLDSLTVNAVLTCGAAIEYVAGAVPTPPRWMGRIGLEWFYRLLSDPRRLGRRYLVEPWFLTGLLLRDLLGRPGRSKT